MTRFPHNDLDQLGGPATRTKAAGAGEAMTRERDDRTLPPDFALTLERLEDGTTVLALAGELDLYRAPEIEDALAQALGPGRDRRGGSGGTLLADGDQSGEERGGCVTVDLRAVTFLDSTALAILLDASRRQHARGSELIVLVGPATPTTAFEVTGLDRLLSISKVGVSAAVAV